MKIWQAGPSKSKKYPQGFIECTVLMRKAEAFRLPELILMLF